MSERRAGEIFGGARDGESFPMRKLVAFWLDNQWHLYEQHGDGNGRTAVYVYVGIINLPPAEAMTAVD